MKLLFKSLVISSSLAAVSLMLPLSTFADTNTKPVAVDSIDINKYAGKWYEIAHLPMFFSVIVQPIQLQTILLTRTKPLVF